MLQQMEVAMDQDTKHQIVVLALSTLAAIPVVTVAGLAIVTGVLAWQRCWWPVAHPSSAIGPNLP